MAHDSVLLGRGDRRKDQCSMVREDIPSRKQVAV